MSVTYTPNATVSKLPSLGETNQTKMAPSQSTGVSFGDRLFNGAKEALHNIEAQGIKAEALTKASAQGEASRLEHVMALNNLTDTLSLGTKALEKATEAFEKTLRVLG